MKNKTRQIKLGLILVLCLLAVIFVVLNTDNVAINFGFFNLKVPLIIILVVMVIIGILIGWFCGANVHKHDENN